MTPTLQFLQKRYRPWSAGLIIDNEKLLLLHNAHGVKFRLSTY